MDFFALKKIVSFLVTPVPLAVLTLTIAFVAVWFSRVSAWVRWPLTMSWLLLVLIPVTSIPEEGLRYYERLYPAFQTDEHRPVEQIMVLACYVVNAPELPVTSQHHACSRGRLVEALRIWRENPDADILLSGGPMRFGESSLAQKGADFLAVLGVPREKLVVIPKGRDTSSEALAYKPYLKSATPVLVTSGTHMKRAVRLFARHGMSVIPAPAEYLVLSNQGEESSESSDWRYWVPTAGSYYRMERLWYTTLANTLVTLQAIFSDEPNSVEMDLPQQISIASPHKSAPEQGAAEAFAELLKLEHVEEAVELYEQQLKSGLEDELFPLAYSHFLKQAQVYPELVLAEVEKFLAVEPDNPHWHYLALICSAHQSRYSRAMKEITYYRDAYIPESLSESVTQLQQKVIKSYSEILLAGADLNAVTHLIEQLDYIGESHYSALLRRKVQLIERKEYLSSLYPIQLPLKRVGKHHLVEVMLNGEVNVELMLDTGASSVAISRDVISGTHYTVKREGVVFSTANGRVKQDLVVLDRFTIGDIELENFEVSLMDNYPASKDAGLLGQNFLSLFDWKLDQEANVLHLAPK